jgi:hypothetical protein
VSRSRPADANVMEVVRALALALARARARALQNGLLSGNHGLGAPSSRPSVPLTEPQSRMVEPRS